MKRLSVRQRIVDLLPQMTKWRFGSSIAKAIGSTPSRVELELYKMATDGLVESKMLIASANMATGRLTYRHAYRRNQVTP